MSRLLIVHGTAGPVRTDASVRLEWITSMLDGLALAGLPCPDLDREVALVNLDDGTAVPPPPDPAWEAAILERCRLVARFDADPPAGRAEGTAGELAWSRYFSGLPADELAASLRQVRSHLVADALGRRSAARVRRAIDVDTRVVIGHCVGGIAAMRAVTALDSGDAPALVTIGTPPELPGATPERHAARAPSRWTDIVDVHDTLVLAGAADAGVASGAGRESGAGAARVTMDCDPRLRCARNYLASPEFGAVLGAVLTMVEAG